jgi:hypothetical protein
MRGFWYIIEVVLAGVIIFGFLAVLGRTYIALPEPTDLSIMGYEALKSLDDQGLLRSYVVDKNYTGLNSIIKMGRYSHSVKICGYSSTCVGPTPNATDIWVAVYAIAGNESYSPHEVRLFAW